MKKKKCNRFTSLAFTVVKQNKLLLRTRMIRLSKWDVCHLYQCQRPALNGKKMLKAEE